MRRYILSLIALTASLFLNGSRGYFSGKEFPSEDIPFFRKYQSPAFFSLQDSWVEQKLAAMSLAEKAGQVVFPGLTGRFYSDDDAAWKKLEHYVRNLHVGGFVSFPTGLYQQAVLVNKLQAAATIPLLFSADIERGIVFRSEEATQFPSAMAVGAADDTALAAAMGEIIAEEGRSVGIRLNFAPVADLSNDSRNPIINLRSFGSDPRRVSSYAARLVKGMQRAGMIACVKHFPGHGATSVDSHKDLPVVELSAGRLDSVELLPFRESFAAGALACMPGHLAVPALDPAGLPASLSKSIITGLLQSTMAFKGLVVTDALEMRAVTRNYSAAAMVTLALNAGVDVLLMPENEDSTVAAIINAVAAGAVAVSRLDDAVRKILLAKRWAGLDQAPFVRIDDIPAVTGKMEHRRAAEQLALKSITVLKDKSRILPLRVGPAPKAVHLVMIDSRLSDYPSRFHEQLTARMPGCSMVLVSETSPKSVFRSIPGILKGADKLIISLYQKIGSAPKPAELPPHLRELMKKVTAIHKKAVLAVHGNPFILGTMPVPGTVITNYGDGQISEEALVKVLFGEAPAVGKSPVDIPAAGIKPGSGITYPASVLSLPGSSTSCDFSAVDSLMQTGLRDSIAPAMMLLVAKDGKILLQKGYGRLTYSPEAPQVTDSTIFDMASVSKVIATTTAAMICIDRKLFSLDDPVVKYIKAFGAAGKEKITIRNLLLHNTGLPAFKRYYTMVATADEVLKDIYTCPLDYPTGTKTVYSDLGLITLGKVIEKVTGTTLDKFCAKEIFVPLGMSSTGYNPSPLLRYRIAPTEIDKYWRNRLLVGEVHDENASLLGGVAGHAGLFSTAPDIARFLQMLLQGGTYNGREFIKPETLRLFTAKQSESSSRALGWDTKSKTGSSAGSLFSDNAYGHTGYTGTSVWTDPVRKVFVILLTNRVHPTRENPRLGKFRPVLHDLVIQAVDNAGA